MQERRSKIRIKYDLPLIVNRYNGKQLRASGLNLSPDGLAIRSDLALISGETVSIDLPLDDGSETVAATVTYTVSVTTPEAGHQIGLEFQNLNEAQQQRLEDYVYEHAREVTPQPLDASRFIKR